jgi:DNA-binding NtrC family response regulator
MGKTNGKGTKIVLTTFDLGEIEEIVCQKAIDRTETFTEAAELLGITRHALYRRVPKLGLEPKHLYEF